MLTASAHQLAADRRPPIGLAMTYLVEDVPRTGRVCYYERGSGQRWWMVCDDLSPNVWRVLALEDRRIVEPPEYRRPTCLGGVAAIREAEPREHQKGILS